jgi:hypothetical protein
MCTWHESARIGHGDKKRIQEMECKDRGAILGPSSNGRLYKDRRFAIGYSYSRGIWELKEK